MTKIKKALLSVLCCFALIFCSAFVFTACTKADMTAYNIKIDEAIQSGWVKVQGDAIAGEEITIVLTPDEGYELVPGSLKVNGKEIVGNKFIMPERNVNVTAKFKKINYAVNTGNIEHGTIDIEVNEQNIATGDKLEWDTKVTLTPVPEKGYECTYLEVLNGGFQVLAPKEGDKYSFIMPKGNITINATFEKITYSLAKASEHGTFTIPATASYGDIVEVTGITPDPGYVFSKIIFNGNTITGTSFEMPDKETTVQVVFEAVEYTVSIANNVEHANIRLLKSGSSHYFTSLKAYYGDTITVSVTPDEGYEVSAIKVNGDAISGDSFVVREDSVVTVELTAIDYSITVKPSENGSIIVSDKTTPVHVGDLITLTVNPKETYKLENLIIKNGDSLVARQVNGNTVTFTMPAGDVTISATFAQNVNEVKINPTENGNVSATPVNALEGAEVVLTVSPATGYKLKSLKVMFGETEITVVDNKFTMPAGEVTVIATFEIIDYTITVNPAEHGSFTVSKTPANYNDEITITVTPNIGYELDQILVDEEEITGTTFTMPAKDVTVKVTFKKATYAILVDENIENDLVSVDQTIANMGNEITITVKPEVGYAVDSVYVTYKDENGEEKHITANLTSVENEYSFIMPAGDVKIFAVFVEPKAINVVSSENGRVTADKENAFAGETVTITVTPNTGYVVGEIKINGSSDGVTKVSDTVYTFIMPASSVQVEVAFYYVLTASDIEYATSGTDLTIKKVTTRKTYYKIPSTFNIGGTTYSVTSIGGISCIDSDVVALILPNTVTRIGYSAFNGCTSLTSITIPNSITSIGDGAFNGCTSLTSITIPSSVTSIGNSAFKNCTGLTSITIPSSVTSIGSSAFFGCTGLTSITIPSGVTSIGDVAFSGCTGLTSVTIPESVTSISYGAFYGCTGLTSITIPNSVTSIDMRAFENCTGLTSITISEGVTSIGEEAFKNCTGLTSITIPSSVTSIDMRTFENCTGLTSITISEGVTSIGEEAFKNCTGLTSITIPSSVTSIGSSAFSGCTGLTLITISEGVTSIGASAFYGCTNLTSITIPEGVTSIGDFAFHGCTSLTSITIPSSVTSIDKYTFFNCTSLTSITIPSSVTSIGDWTFDNCSKLTSITISEGVTSIGDFAFQGCTSLTSITIPSSVTNIGGSAFLGCRSLTSIVVAEGNTKYNSGNGANCIIKKETNTLILGCKNTVIPSSVTSISNRAFCDCTGLTSITIPEGVTSIGSEAFSRCTSLTSITIPSSVTSIGGYAFSGCTGLTSIIIPNGVTSIDYETFSGCTSLTSITIPNSVTRIDSSAFTNTGLYNNANDGDLIYVSRADGKRWLLGYKGTEPTGSLEIPNDVVGIADDAFYGCIDLTSVTIPSSVTSIGGSAFSGCTGLTSVTIPESVTSISYGAFSGCSGLTSITFTGTTPPTIGYYVLGDCTSLTKIYVPAGSKTAYETALASSEFTGTIVEQ